MTTEDKSPGLRVLLVEDEPIIAMLLEEILEDMGHQVVAQAGSLADALNEAGQTWADVALLDLNLAGENALPVAEALDARNIPFIFTTGYGSHGVPTRWATRPVLCKPYSEADLRNAFRQAVGDAAIGA